MADDKDKESPQHGKTIFERTPNYVETYANSIIYEPTAWDLKLKFGVVEGKGSDSLVKQHLTVTIPWPQAKIALYWLRVNVEAMELQTGKTPLRTDLIPPEPIAPPPDLPENEKAISQAIYELVVRLREEFIANL